MCAQAPRDSNARTVLPELEMSWSKRVRAVGVAPQPLSLASDPQSESDSISMRRAATTKHAEPAAKGKRTAHMLTSSFHGSRYSYGGACAK